MIPTADDLEQNQKSVTRPKLAGSAYQAIKPTKGQVDLTKRQLMCTKCSKFDNVTNRSVIKVMMKHDDRNELYRCERCNNVVSDATVAYTLGLDLPQYVYWESEDDKDIDTLLKEREEEEKYTIVSIVSDPPNRVNKKKIAKVIK